MDRENQKYPEITPSLCHLSATNSNAHWPRSEPGSQQWPSYG